MCVCVCVTNLSSFLPLLLLLLSITVNNANIKILIFTLIYYIKRLFLSVALYLSLIFCALFFSSFNRFGLRIDEPNSVRTNERKTNDLENYKRII